jgi:hypothetical protein
MCCRSLCGHNRKTERFLFAALITFCFCLRAVGQNESDGSIVLARWMKGDLVVAADSRENTPAGTYRDDRCKIVTFGDKLIFASSGRMRVSIKPLVDFNTFTTAHRIYPAIHNKGTFKDLLMSFARAWGDSAKKQLEPVKDLASRGLDGIGNNITMALFTGYDEQGTVQLVDATVSYTRSGNGAVKLTDSAAFDDTVKWSSHTLGHDEIVDEFTAANTPRSIEWHKKMADAEASTFDKNAADVLTILQLTIDYLPKTRMGIDGKPFSAVGGEIAAVEMTPDHRLRWIAPGHCQTQAEKPKPQPTTKKKQ